MVTSPSGATAHTAKVQTGLRVAVADPRQLIADALAAILEREDRFEVVCVAAGDVSAAAIIAAAPELVLLGVGRAGAGPVLSLIDVLIPRLPQTQIVLVADSLSGELVDAVLQRSLGGLLLTDSPGADLVSSLQHIAHGRAILPAGWQQALGRGRGGPLDALSDRQLEVLRLLAEGCSYEEIGVRLFISVNTVKFHTRSIFERLGVRNRMAAARLLAEATASAAG